MRWKAKKSYSTDDYDVLCSPGRGHHGSPPPPPTPPRRSDAPQASPARLIRPQTTSGLRSGRTGIRACAPHAGTLLVMGCLLAGAGGNRRWFLNPQRGCTPIKLSSKSRTSPTGSARLRSSVHTKLAPSRRIQPTVIPGLQRSVVLLPNIPEARQYLTTIAIRHSTLREWRKSQLVVVPENRTGS